MKIEQRHIVRRVAALMMLMLFVNYYVGVNLSWHTHIINGVTVVHSHLHTNHHHDTEGGGHTSSQLTLIANVVSQSYLSGDAVPVEVSTLESLVLSIGVELESKVVSHHYKCSPLRAPPAPIC